MIKICIICGNEFQLIKYASKQKCCSAECSNINTIRRIKRYNSLECNKLHTKQYQKAYRQTEDYKQKAKLIRATDKYKEDQRRYDHSLKGKQTKKNHLKRYMYTQEYKQTQKKYLHSDLGKASNRRRGSNRYARKNNIIETYTEQEWQQKLISTNGICPGFEVEPHYVGIKYLDRDHIYSVKRASEDFKRTGIKRIYTINDMQPLCRCCNGRKQDRLVEPILVPIIIPESKPKGLNTQTTNN